MSAVRWLLIVCLSILFMGCSSALKKEEINIAEELCRAQGGVFAIEPKLKLMQSDYYFEVICTNGSAIVYSKRIDE